ncbi:hypothetical protein J3F83DRAFT_564645 [Trichoderma novae-zelandiae]
MDGLERPLAVAGVAAIRRTDHAVQRGNRPGSSAMATEQLPLSTEYVRPILAGICHVAVSDLFDKQRTRGPCRMFQIGSIERQTSLGHGHGRNSLNRSVAAKVSWVRDACRTRTGEQGPGCGPAVGKVWLRIHDVAGSRHSSFAFSAAEEKLDGSLVCTYIRVQCTQPGL